jgi:hypothetical protein
MELQQVAKLHPVLPWHDFDYRSFDLVRFVAGFGEPKPLRNPGHMRVHTDGRLTKGVAQNDVRRLASHPRKRQQIFKPIRHLPTEVVEQRPARILDRAGFVAVEVEMR